MPSLCPKHRQQISASPQHAVDHYKQQMLQGKQLHNKRAFKKACGAFSLALQVAQQLIDLRPLEGTQNYIQLKIAASHNLSASFSALGQLSNASQVLEDLHQSLLKVCLAPAVPRQLRIIALGALDNSLFSLTSSLGAQGRVDQLYRVISETDRVAELAAVQLLH